MQSIRRGPHLRILVVNWQDRTSRYAGGAEVHLHQIFGRLARRGHEVTVLCSGWKGADQRTVLDDMTIHRAGGRHTFVFAARRYFDAHLRAQPFDVVVEDLNKVPLLVHRWTAKPFALLVHHLWGKTALRAANPLVAAAAWGSEATLLRAYRGKPVQAVSDSTASDLVWRGIAPSDIRVITNGVAPLPDADAAHPDPRPTLVAVGRLQPYKRVDMLLRVVARVRERVPAVRLIVIGGGPEAERLQRQVASSGLEGAVELRGSVSEEDKRAALASAWLHVTASEREGWGLTVLEAAVYGVPTVACDVHGLRDSVAHERSGVLVPDGDTAAFADAVVDLLEHPERRAELGAGARRLTRYYTWERAASATEEHLQEVAALGRSRRGWEPLSRRPPELPALAGPDRPPLPYGRTTFVVLASVGGHAQPAAIRVTLGAEDPAGNRPAALVEGLPAGVGFTPEALSSAADCVPVGDGLLLRLPGWPVRPERWIWEELGAALNSLRPRAVYRE